MLLAFSHFEHNQAKLTHKDYEGCLRTMWNEISRVYANRPITLPLLVVALRVLKIFQKKVKLICYDASFVL